MLKKIVKGALVLAASTAAFAATPASAGVLIQYLYWDGYIWAPAGQEVYNDCGVLVYKVGGVTPDYASTYYVIPC